MTTLRAETSVMMTKEGALFAAQEQEMCRLVRKERRSQKEQEWVGKSG